MDFGATLRLLRMDAGWTLRELAEHLGVSSAYLSRVENGHDAPPTPDRLAVIARLFGLAPTTLIELADRIAPFTTDYLGRSDAARALFLEIARRDLAPVEIARVRAFIEREFPRPTARRTPEHPLAAMLDPDRVITGLSCSELEDVIDVAAPKLASTARRTAREVREAILARERLCPTALGGGLAVPHAIFERVPPVAAVVILRRGLDVGAPDGLAVKVFIVHIDRGGREHARTLAEMARLADHDRVSALCAERRPAGIVSALLARE